MVKGGPSLNPGGRRPGVLSFAERVRQRVDPDTLIDRTLAIVEDPEATHRDVMTAIAFLHGSAWAKPPTTTDVTITATERDEAFAARVAAMPIERRREALEAYRKARALTAGAAVIDIEGSE